MKSCRCMQTVKNGANEYEEIPEKPCGQLVEYEGGYLDPIVQGTSHDADNKSSQMLNDYDGYLEPMGPQGTANGDNEGLTHIYHSSTNPAECQAPDEYIEIIN